MHVNEVLELLNKMKYDLKRIQSEEEFEHDYNNAEERFKNNMARKVAHHAEELYYLAEWLAKPIKAEGRLVKNSSGRYEIEGTDYYFTSGSAIEVWDTEDEVYVRTRIEYTNEDYYAYAFGPEVKLEGLRARTR